MKCTLETMTHFVSYFVHGGKTPCYNYTGTAFPKRTCIYTKSKSTKTAPLAFCFARFLHIVCYLPTYSANCGKTFGSIKSRFRITPVFCTGRSCKNNNCNKSNKVLHIQNSVYLQYCYYSKMDIFGQPSFCCYLCNTFLVYAYVLV